MIEYACKDLVFHFNKKHLEDDTIPMWVIKTHGKSFYVNHVSSSLQWSTKETPTNDHTKGSIKFKRCLLRIDDNNCAEISELSKEDEVRLANSFDSIRVITQNKNLLSKSLEQLSIKSSQIVKISGHCRSSFYITEFFGSRQLSMLGMVITDLRILQPNEDYYRWYSIALAKNLSYFCIDDEFENDFDDEDKYDAAF